MLKKNTHPHLLSIIKELWGEIQLLYVIFAFKVSYMKDKRLILVLLFVSTTVWVLSLFLYNLHSSISSTTMFRVQDDILTRLSSGAMLEPVINVDLTNRGLTVFPVEVSHHFLWT